MTLSCGPIPFGYHAAGESASRFASAVSLLMFYMDFEYEMPLDELDLPPVTLMYELSRRVSL